jgi:hypothetical protein
VVSTCMRGTQIGARRPTRRHQKSSEVIRGHQRSSEVIRGHPS